MAATLDGDELEQVYEYNVAVNVRNVLGDRINDAFPKDKLMWAQRLVFIKTDSTKTIADLQDALEERGGIPVHRQRLFFDNRFIDDEELPVRDLNLAVKRPNSMDVEDQAAVDWLAERRRRFKALEASCLVPLPPAAQAMVDHRTTAQQLDGRLKLIFDAVSKDSVSAPRDVVMEELKAIVPGVCPEFKAKLQSPHVQADFAALDAGRASVGWDSLNAWWTALVSEWNKAAITPWTRSRRVAKPVVDRMVPQWRAVERPAEAKAGSGGPDGSDGAGGAAPTVDTRRGVRSASSTQRPRTPHSLRSTPSRRARLIEHLQMATWPWFAETKVDSETMDASVEALKVFQPDIDKNPNDLWARLTVGIALFTLQRLAEAKPHLEFAARELPMDARVQYRYAVVQEEVGDWKGSMDTLKRVVDLAPGWAMPQRDLGSLLFNRGDVWGAVHHWTIASRLSPDVLPLRAQLGIVLYILGFDASEVPGADKLRAVGAGFGQPPKDRDKRPTLARPRRSSATDGARPPFMTPVQAQAEGLGHLRYTMTSGWTRRELFKQLEAWPVPVVEAGDTVFGLVENRGRSGLLRTPDFLPIYRQLAATDWLWEPVQDPLLVQHAASRSDLSGEGEHKVASSSSSRSVHA